MDSRKTLFENFPVKTRIFHHQDDFVVVEKVSDLWVEGRQLVVEMLLSNLQKSYLRIEVWTDQIIRFSYHQKKWPKKRFAEHLNSELEPQKVVMSQEGDRVSVNLTSQEKILIAKKTGQIELVDRQGEVKWRLCHKTGYRLFANLSTPHLGFKNVRENKNLPFISFELFNDEKIYGLGEKFRPFVKNGVESVVWNSDSSCLTNHDLAYAGVPLVYSTKNWAALVNSGSQVDFEIGSPTSDALSILCHEEFLDLFLLSGSSIKDCVSQYTLLTGRIKGVPDLAYGVWLNRLYYHNAEQLWEQIKLAQKNAYPLDVITLDPKWLKDRYVKSCNFELNESVFGNFAQLIDQIKKVNLEVCFWINPYIQADGGYVWKHLSKNNLLLKNHEGQLVHPWTGTETQQNNNYIVDFTNPEAYRWYKEQIKRLFDLGVRFVKPDYGDGVPKNAFVSSRQFGGTLRQWFIYLYLRCCYEASLEYFGDGQALIFARPGFIGTQKFVGKWSGDSYTDYAFLKTHLWAGLSGALAGHVIWGTDIGGFAGPQPSEDLYQRWTQFGMLTPLSRYHGIGAREPWLFSNQTYQIALKFAHFKRSLLPYFKIYEQEAVSQGLPILRPLVLEYQSDKIAQLVDDQYLLGQQIMVCPILTANTNVRQVYLPAGQWHLWGEYEKVYQGQKLVTLDCPADQALVFVKSGSLIITVRDVGFKFADLNGLTFLAHRYGQVANQTLSFKLGDQVHVITYEDGHLKINSDQKVELVPALVSA